MHQSYQKLRSQPPIRADEVIVAVAGIRHQPALRYELHVTGPTCNAAMRQPHRMMPAPGDHSHNHAWCKNSHKSRLLAALHTFIAQVV